MLLRLGFFYVVVYGSSNGFGSSGGSFPRGRVARAPLVRRLPMGLGWVEG